MDRSCITRISCIPEQHYHEIASHFIYSVVTKFYQHMLALAFAIHEINQNPRILPNITLGFRIYDSYTNARMTYRLALDLLFRSHWFVPNYKCGANRNLIGVIGGIDFDTSSLMADILSLYRIPQVKTVHGSCGLFSLYHS